jgi:hypothetical protein
VLLLLTENEKIYIIYFGFEDIGLYGIDGEI